jgi:hypothetical protein
MVPALAQSAALPEGAQGVYLDIDGCPLASDAYTKMLGEIAQMLPSQAAVASAAPP